MTRSVLLSILITAAVGWVVWENFRLWGSGPWDLPGPRAARVQPTPEASKAPGSSLPIPSTDVIITKNLFDPERGASFTREVEANSKSFQRVRGMILLGTAVLGNNRFAVLQDGATAQPRQGAQETPAPLRVKQGETLEGFTLSEVADKKVVFSKGPARIELQLDYFRKVETQEAQVPTPRQTRPLAGQGRFLPGQGRPVPGQIRPSSPIAPRVIPNLPRRLRQGGRNLEPNSEQ